MFYFIIYGDLGKITSTEQAPVQVTEQVEKLLKAMNNKEYPTKELMELLGLKHRPSYRYNYLLPALELGYIEMTISDKTNISKQKYKQIDQLDIEQLPI